MGMRISTNVASLNAQRNLATSQRSIEKSFGQLASGSRITKSADDAAGLAISENFKGQIRSYRAAQRNAQDAQSMVQVAEGGLNEISNILTRLRELGVQASSDNIGTTERSMLNKEVQQLIMESERISQSTRFGKTQLLNGEGGQFSFQIDIHNDDFKDRISFDASDINATATTLGVMGMDFSERDQARAALEVLDQAQLTVSGHRATLGSVQSRLISTGDNIGIQVENLSAANSRIRDTDIAESSAELTRNSILLNASTSVAQQANVMPQAALKLLS